MFQNKIFQTALLISVVIHAAVLLQNPNFNLFPTSKERKEAEVSYIKKTEAPKEAQKKAPLKSEQFLKIPDKISVDKRIPPPFIDKENILKTPQPIKAKEEVFNKPTFAKTDVLAIKKKITLPPIETSKINNPSYLSYYQLVREKIKRAAYQNYTGQEVGEVMVSFLVDASGSLKDLRLVEEKSSRSAYLREVALKSVQDASPFPSFPKELDYPHLSFNLAITFEIE